MLKQPSFFIVGAPKSGTTALCKYLNRHPQIFIPEEKELRYFNSKNPSFSLEKYLDFFKDGRGMICGEGTPSYLRSETAAARIYEFNPDSKIIIMLREPVALLYSFHSQLLWNGGSEDETDFVKALNLESERRAGRCIPAKCSNVEHLFYRNVVQFTAQIKRYLQYFDRSKIHIIIFDDFVSDSNKSYREVLNFLEVDPNFNTTFNSINSRKKVRSYFLQDLYRRPPAKLLEIGKYFIPLPQEQRRELLNKIKNYLKKNNKQVLSKEEKKLPLAIHKALQQEFIPEIQLLSQLIDRDLSHWFL
jgi:hypothetical protein